MDYNTFIQSKAAPLRDQGKIIDRGSIHKQLYPFQADIVEWACRKGRAAIFADVGLGKTIMQCEIARQLNVPTLIIAPLVVSQQTVRLIQVLLSMRWHYVRHDADIDLENTTPFYITNYEMVVNGNITPSHFNCVMLDESSILKSFSGTTRKALQTACMGVPYKFAFTATPAPNDLLEITNHSDWLELQDGNGDVLTGRRIIAKYFTPKDAKKAGEYRLKRHAEDLFYQWLANWAVALTKPSDIGDYDDSDYILPSLNTVVHEVNADYTPITKIKANDGNVWLAPQMFPKDERPSATEAKRLRRDTVSSRAQKAASLINSNNEQWLVFCALNDEAEILQSLVEGSLNLHGSLKVEEKSDMLMQFVDGHVRVLITKASIAGSGVNLQNCHNILFLGVDYSWEQYYQAIGRCRRYGQSNDIVNNHIVISHQERGILNVIQKKGKEADTMKQKLINASQLYMKYAIHHLTPQIADDYKENDAFRNDHYHFMLGDSCKRMAEIPESSVHGILYSPPFGHTLYIYSNTPRDLGNNNTLDQFMTHYRFIISETLRVLMPGRMVGVHIQDTKIYAANSEIGERGVYPLSDDIVQAHIEAGFVYRGRVTIDKNPQLVATRNNDNDLLFQTGKRDSTDLAPMNTDYILLFKKPGDNPIPVQPYENGSLTEEDWIRLAHPIWWGISETDTLNVLVAKGAKDERHICPLQLGVIDNFVRLYTNPGETLFSPFGGIGSEGYQAILRGRKALLIELKEEYWRVGTRNLENAVIAASQNQLM